jgi:hypothetical protein
MPKLTLDVVLPHSHTMVSDFETIRLPAIFQSHLTGCTQSDYDRQNTQHLVFWTSPASVPDDPSWVTLSVNVQCNIQ